MKYKYAIDTNKSTTSQAVLAQTLSLGNWPHRWVTGPTPRDTGIIRKAHADSNYVFSLRR